MRSRHANLASISLVVLCLPLLYLTACVNTNPFAQAQTTEQQALATYGSFVILKEQAAKLYVDPATPESVKLALRKANNAVTGPISKMYDAALAFKEMKDALAAGLTTEEKLQIAADNLLYWYLLARPLYDDFDKTYADTKIRRPE